MFDAVMGSNKLFCVLTGDPNPLIEIYDSNLKKLDEFCKKHNVHMGHWKFTCPNPYLENVFGQRIWGFTIDLENKAGLFLTHSEYQLAWDYDSSPKTEVSFESLLESDPFYTFRGKIAGKSYGL